MTVVWDKIEAIKQKQNYTAEMTQEASVFMCEVIVGCFIIDALTKQGKLKIDKFFG